MDEDEAAELALAKQAADAAEVCMREAKRNVEITFGPDAASTTHTHVVAAFMQAMTMYAITRQITDSLDDITTKIEEGLAGLYDEVEDLKAVLDRFRSIYALAHDITERTS